MLTSNEIRNAFFKFFESKQHLIIPSAPIVVKNDPTLFFTNSGMAPLKDYFLGYKTPNSSRIADTQKCLRVSGKHNDLEEVGVDTYHHTMFEMLGNWSFGDYFKKEAIAWAWELLTEIYKIPKNRLYATYFEGDDKEDLEEDLEAKEYWSLFLPEDRILKGNKKNNFWEMGDMGPCGPCSEIHIDCRTDEEIKKIDCRTLVNTDHPEVIEIWNLVFMQFQRLKNGQLQPLIQKHVDTGMGFERLVRVLQKKKSNYDTDIFLGIIQQIEKLTSEKYTGTTSKKDISFRVLSDHLRAISFSIADGQLPSNTGAGYVIRRILRRAVRYYYSYLHVKQPLLTKLVEKLAQEMALFTEIKIQQHFIEQVIKEEEEAFLHTLEKGLKRIEEITIINHCLEGAEAFELYDTYGFPLDLISLIAEEKGWKIDEEGFEKEMQKQKNRSRNASNIDIEDWVVCNLKKSSFIGYTTNISDTTITRYRKVNDKNKSYYQVVLEKTPFYAESGGQVGDTGLLLINQKEIPVFNTKKENGLFLHFVDSIPENNNVIIAKINENRRKNIAIHHSATHLMHAALKKVLGTHVAQKGSFINDQKLRFDFSHFSAITTEQIEEVEKIVNQKIRENIITEIEEMPKEEALKKNITALFGEKYCNIVRVITMGKDFSIELCGGTHVKATGDIGFFKIIHETNVAAGVRRIEAVAGEVAEKYILQEEHLFQSIKKQLKNTKNILKSIQHLQNENIQQKKDIEFYQSQIVETEVEKLSKQATVIKEVTFVGEIVKTSSIDLLKKIALSLSKNQIVCVLCSIIDQKAQVIISANEEICKRKNLNFSTLLKTDILPLIDGVGGGKPNFVSAIGKNE
ncbi:MAG: alanine--tRNA ligase, partial [Chitinophagaceae bacterium]